MPLNGSGSASPPGANYPAVANSLATAADRNAIDADIYSCLSSAVFKDGQQTMTADLPLGGFKITGLGDATAQTGAATIKNVVNGTGVYVATVGGTASAITLTPSPAITAYAAGQRFAFIAGAASTGATTVNVSSLGAKNITKQGAQAIIAGDIAINNMTVIQYDGTQFILQNPVPSVPKVCEGRLTLTSGTPVTTSDVTAAETVYFTPYKGNQIALYDGTIWKTYTFTELSVDVPNSTNMQDVFIYDNSGTLTLELTAWTNITTRATALTTQNGVLVKSGSTTKRYLGSFESNAVGNGTTEDSYANRLVWNYYNRVRRPMKATESTNTWTYSTASYRQANANVANDLTFVVGVSEDLVSADVLAAATNSTGTPRVVTVGIGLDSTTVNSATVSGTAAVTTTGGIVTASYRDYPSIGAHALVWLEMGAGSDTQTWVGDNGGSGTFQSGITGEIWA